MKYYYILLLMLLDTLLLMFLPSSGKGQGVVERKQIVLNILYKEAKPTDTLTLTLSNTVNFFEPIGIYKRAIENGRFRFVIPVDDHYGYLQLQKRRTFADEGEGGNAEQMVLMTEPRFWVSGDSIDLNISYKEQAGGIGIYNTCYFTGRGSLKYNLSQKIDSIFASGAFDIPSDTSLSTMFLNPLQAYHSDAMLLIDKSKNHLSPIEYNVLRANIIYYNGNLVFSRISRYYKKIQEDHLKVEFLNAYQQNASSLASRDVPVAALENSRFINFLYQKYRNESILNNGKVDFEWIYKTVKQNETGRIRDRLMPLFFIMSRKSDGMDSIIKDAEATITDRYSLQTILKYKSQIAGKELGDFTLFDTNDKEVKLSEFKGRIVFLDFWGYGCGACHVFYKDALSKVKKVFRNDPGVAFVSIGIDRKKGRWIDAIESNMYTSKDAINLTTGIAGYSHPALAKNNISAVPTAILLDRAGKIIKFNTADLYSESTLREAINSIK